MLVETKVIVRVVQAVGLLENESVALMVAQKVVAVELQLVASSGD